MDPVDLNLLRTFLAVYRSRSFTAAAPGLGLSQPTVTAHVRALEKHYDRQLFVRLPRGVEPSSFAHELAARVARPLDALDDGQTRDDVHRPPVRLAGPSELLCTRVLPALADLVASGVQLRVAQGMTDPLIDEMRSGQHDLVIATRRPRGGALRSVPLADEEYVLIAAPNWAGPEPDLAAIPLVSYAEDMPIVRRYWRMLLGRATPPGPPALTVPNLHAVLAAVTAGAGYSVVPRSIAEDHLADARVVELHRPSETPLNTYFLVERPGADGNPDVPRVAEALRRGARTW